MTEPLSGKVKRHRSTKVVIVFIALSNDLSLELFKLIAATSGTARATGPKLLAASKLTRKSSIPD